MKNLFYLVLAVLFFSCGKTDTSNQTIVPTKRDEKMVENKKSEITKSEEVKVKKTAADFKYDANNELPQKYFSGAISSEINEKNASVVVLKGKELQNLYKDELELIRNLVYARHGYIFKNPDFKYIFEGVDWYIPISEDVNKDLTEVEVKNIELIKRYETHAKKYVYER